MDPKKPIFWHQGQFLQPQHFQLTDRYHESLLSPYREFMVPYFWGAADLEVLESGLMNGRFEITRGAFVFQDGTAVTYPGNAVIEPRSFEDAWTETQKPLTVYVGLRRSAGTEDVDVVTSLADAQGRLGRFAATTDPAEVSDLYSKGPAARVRELHYVLRLFWETELDQAQSHDLIPVARLERDGKDVRLSEQFVPPLVTISGSPLLRRIVKDIGDRLVSRCRQLETYKSPRETQVGGLEVGYLVFLLALRSLNRLVPLYLHCTEAPHVHPWMVFGLLRQLVGELSTFTESLSSTGERPDGTKAMPDYDHERIFECFAQARALIDQLIESLTLGPEHVIHFDADGRFLTAKFQPSHFVADATYWLAIRTELPEAEVLDAVRSAVKMSASGSLTTLIARAVPGVPLRHFPAPPPGLPRHANTYYFLVDRDSSHWSEVQRTMQVSLYWDGRPEDLSADLAVLRS